MENDDELDRRALSEWQELRAPVGFSDRVMQRLEPAVVAPRRWLWSGLGALTGVAATLAVLLALRGQPARAPVLSVQEGESAATTERVTVRAGDRATVVLEPGARITWRGEPGGPFVVEQRLGEAFYRVEAGETPTPFVVKTPQGPVEVLGTCFTLRVTRARTEVLTHEGVVRVGTILVRAGDHVQLDRRGVEPVTRPAEPTVATSRVAVTAPPANCACEEDVPTFEPPAADLQRWARECRVRADLAPMDYDESYIAELMQSLGLDGDDAVAAREAIAVVEERANADLRRIYGDATGDTGAPGGPGGSGGSVPTMEMFEAVIRSADAREHAEVRRRLSAERAGQVAPPTDLTEVTPYEELVRSMFATGDALEQELGRRLGPARARDLRRRHGGWPTLHWHDVGCPGEGH